ncbi:MAG: pirin family protein [Proteobacteria bacterium]|nr:MAG: pirin family protein [Pseudomonadota bacterium]
MLQPKIVQKLHPATRDDIQDLVTRRPLPNPHLPDLDPFLFLNHHGPQVYPPKNDGLPFGPHPHRGFATVTFIHQGSLSHEDSSGGEKVVTAGGVQWMSAGRGLVHAELSPETFKQNGGPLEILQLWVNLPARLKLSPPRYEGFEAEEIPLLNEDEGRVKVKLLSGQWAGVSGPLVAPVDLVLADLHFSPAGNIKISSPAGESLLFYVVKGSVNVNGVPVLENYLAEFGRAEGTLDIRSGEGAQVLFGRAMPYGEPIVAYGPFVMNTKAEIAQAIKDYQDGKFS